MDNSSLELVKISNFPESTDVKEWVVVSDAMGNAYKVTRDNFKAFLGTVQVTTPRPIAPTDPSPTLDGVYIPTVDGTYANAGGLIRSTSVGQTDEGMAVEFIKNGAVWVKNTYPLPVQDISKLENETEELNRLVIGIDDVTPNFSTDWDISGFINTSGVETIASNYRRSVFIPVTPGQKFKASLSGSSGVLIVSGYLSNNQGSFVSGSPVNIIGTSPSGVEPVEVDFVIPEGVNYIRLVRALLTPTSSLFLYKQDDASLVNTVNGSDISGVTWSSGYIDSFGGENTVSTYRKSNFIKVKEGEMLSASLSGGASSLIVSAYSSALQVNFLPDSPINIQGSSPTGIEPTRVVFTIPSGVSHIRLVRSNLTPLSDIYFKSAGLEARVAKLEQDDASLVNVSTYSSLKKRFIPRRKAIFSFIFDDLNPSDLLVYSIFKEYNLRPSFALLTSRLNYGSTVNYQNMYMEGASILSHGVTGSNNEAAMKGGRKDLEDRGFVISGWVTNGSVLDPAMLPILKRYYGYGFTMPPLDKGDLPATGFDNSVEPCEMARIGLEVWNRDEVNQAALKSLIDHAITNGLLINFYAHKLPSTFLNSDGVTSSFTEADLRGILAYVRGKMDDGFCEVLGTDDAVYQYYKGLM